MKIDKSVYENILSNIKKAPPETGGIIGWEKSIVTAFVFDKGIEQQMNCYVPNVEIMDSVISRWSREGIIFCGIIHSHPIGQEELSSGDAEYILEILQNMPKKYTSLYFPIVVGSEIIPYKVELKSKRLQIRKEKLKIV